MIQIVAGLKDGVGYKGIQVNWGQANKTVADGSADMNLLPLSAPSDRIAAGLAAGKMRILSVPKETFESDAFQRWARSPGNAPMTMKVSDMGYGDDVEVVSEDGLFRGVTITGADIVHKDMSNKTAKGPDASLHRFDEDPSEEDALGEEYGGRRSGSEGFRLLRTGSLEIPSRCDRGVGRSRLQGARLRQAVSRS